MFRYTQMITVSNVERLLCASHSTLCSPGPRKLGPLILIELKKELMFRGVKGFSRSNPRTNWSQSIS